MVYFSRSGAVGFCGEWRGRVFVFRERVRGGEESLRDGRFGFFRSLSYRFWNLGLILDCRVRIFCLAFLFFRLENLRKYFDCFWLRYGLERVVEYFRVGWRTGSGIG